MTPPPRQQTVTPPRHQTVVTAVLLFLWLALMVFGGLTYMQPEWLQDLAVAGRSYSADTLRRFGDDFYRQGDYAMAAGQYVKALERAPDQEGLAAGQIAAEQGEEVALNEVLLVKDDDQ